MKADYPLLFINSVPDEIQKDPECGNENFIIPSSLLEIRKHFIFVETAYCEFNETKSKHFLTKFLKFTDNGFKIV